MQANILEVGYDGSTRDFAALLDVYPYAAVGAQDEGP